MKGSLKARPKGLAVSYSDILAAYKEVRNKLPLTPLTYSPALSETLNRSIYIKWDNKHRTGSFKERGAVNFLSQLDNKNRQRGICAASAGNHALAISYHAAKFKIPCHIVMPVNAPLVKIQATRNTGAEITLEGHSFNEAYQYAGKYAKKNSLTFVSAFDDARIIAGQGSAGIEILEQCEDFDSVVVPVGGGGLISGIALAIKEKAPQTYILGVQSEWATKQKSSDREEHAPAIPPVTIADGIGVKGIGKLTAPIIAAKVDKLVQINEVDIAKSIIHLLEHERTVVEGAGAAGLGAILEGHLPRSCKRTVIFISGGNIDMNVLSRLIERDMGERGRLLRINVSVPDRPGSLHITTGIVAKSGANVLQVLHDRSFSIIPGNVDITFLLEVKDRAHKTKILKSIREAGLEVREG